MSKNYFTDEQVIELVGKSLPNTKDMKLTKKCLGEFKELMNLAVETAIGEPSHWMIDRKSTCTDVAMQNEHKRKLIKTGEENVAEVYNLPLYSVKELES